MSDSEIQLLPEGGGDDYEPGLSLVHHGTNELHVIVGEEAEGMAEGVSAETFARLQARMASLIERKELREYLDEAIVKWRERRAEVEAEMAVRDADATTEVELLVARCYVDAFQSVRSSLLGELLS